MGANQFWNKVKSDNARQAFKDVKEEAYYMSGHGGYTGTIAEKPGFTMSRKPADISADVWFSMVDDFDEDDKSQEHYHALSRDFQVYVDKWGNALCIPTEDGFIFCGYASY